MKKILLIFSILIFNNVSAQEVSDDSSTEISTENSQVSAQGTDDKKFDFFKSHKTGIKDPFQLRDPFKRDLGKIKSEKKNGTAFKRKGDAFTNVADISNVPLEDIRIVGVLVGPDRRAMAKIKTANKTQEEVFILKEGMTLGVDKAEIKAILPGGVVLVEQIKNVYDQTEFLETILPVSADE